MIENGWMDSFVVVFFFVFVFLLLLSPNSLLCHWFCLLFCFCFVIVLYLWFCFCLSECDILCFFGFAVAIFCIVNVLCIYRPLYTIHGLKATLTGLSGGVVVVWCCLV